MALKPCITVCICTFERPEMLYRLLWGLQDQETGGLYDFDIVVVDNDRFESARPCVELWQQRSKVALNYIVEPEQNIALARNKAVAQVHGDFCCFIDDDEFPDQRWILHLYKTLLHYKSDGVLGPVVPFYESSAPNWVHKGHFFDRRSFATGHVLDWSNSRTGNVLLKRTLFDNSREWFDPKCGSGGEDRDFFRRKIQQGYTFVWCNEARVFESIPAHRWSRPVLLKRALLRGKMAFVSAPNKPKSVLRSVLAFFSYSVLLPFFILLGQHFFMRYFIKSFDHLGKVLTFLGFDVVHENYITGKLNSSSGAYRRVREAKAN